MKERHRDAKWPAPMGGGGGRRPSAAGAGGSYTLLAASPPTSASGSNNSGSHYPPPPPSSSDGGATGAADWLRMERQSSGSSGGGDDAEEGSSVSTANADSKEKGRGEPDRKPGGSGGGSKSWAQQAEEAYQLQLALALRLCSEASRAVDPSFLDAAVAASDHYLASPQSISHRFWVNGCLSYSDKVPDGFYLIQGMDPFIWTLCNDVQEGSRVPSIDSLKAVHPAESSIEVVLIDKGSDSDLRQAISSAFDVCRNRAVSKETCTRLAGIVSAKMGGSVVSSEEHELVPRWRDYSAFLKISSGSVVLPIGKLSVGLCRHRALLFKTLADSINLSCRVVKGCKYCKTDGAASCLVHFGNDREYLIDLIGNPGFLSEPDSLLNGLSSISICSPLHPPKHNSVHIADNFKSLAKKYFLDCQSLNLMFNDPAAGTVIDLEGSPNSSHATNIDFQVTLPHLKNAAQPNDQDGNLIRQQSFSEDNHFGQSVPRSDISLGIDDLIIPWSELVLKEKIGAGKFSC